MWIALAVSAYFLLALNGVADKFLLTKAVKHPIAYAFYGGVTAPLVLLLGLLGYLGSLLGVSFLQREFTLQFLSVGNGAVALLGGMCFPAALYFFYKAIQQTSVSRILPVAGGLVPIFTLILAGIFLDERLSGRQTFAFLFLVLGAVLISFKKQHGEWHAKALGSGAMASFLFAFSFVLEKYIFFHVNFASGLIWTRLGFFAMALMFLIPKKSRRWIFNAPKEASTGNKFVYLGARISGSMAGFFQNYAIKLGSVSLVNALQGTQYAFLLLLTSVLSARYPKIVKEDTSLRKIAQKVLAIILISLGLYFLAV